MSEHRTNKSVRLCIVTDDQAARHAALPAKPQVKLRRGAALDLDQAELFLLSLDHEMSVSPERAAYLLGVCEGHLANLVELVRAVVSP